MVELERLGYMNKYFIIFVISTIPIYFSIYQALAYQFADEWLVTANYITLVTSNIYVMYAYYRVQLFQSIKSALLIRFTSKKVENHLLKYSIFNVIFYLFICYLLPIFIFHSHIKAIYIFMIFLALQGVLLFINECIYNFAFLNDHKILFILPFLFNFLFHFFFVLVWFQ